MSHNALALIEELKSRNIRLVAVSKTKPVNQIKTIYDLGVRDFGENRAQDLVQKYDQLPTDIRWHLIGHLQKNKVKYIIDKVYCIHSVDSLSLTKEINKRAANAGKIVNILLQIKIAEEESKFGLAFSEAEDVLEQIFAGEFPHINLQGFMGMGTFTSDIRQTRREFERLHDFQKSCLLKHKDFKENLKELSVGMSGDYQIAIENGSTMVRIGSMIFGTR